MNNRTTIKNIFKAFLSASMIIILLTVCIPLDDIVLRAQGSGDAKTVDIVYTHDIHSYVDSYTQEINGSIENVGGMARLTTFIKQQREEKGDILLLDGGDLAMGTLFQTMYAEEAIELRLLGMLGYDATTFGNHDFDYNCAALCQMFNTAAEKSDYLPAFTICNIDWNYDNQSTKDIYDALSECNLCDYTIVDKNGVSIAIIGVFGKEAEEDSPTLELSVLDQAESVQKTIDEIKANNSVDMIVVISHGGTDDNIRDSEDEQLAMAVPEIDVIVSAHSHTYLDAPIVHGDTYIMSCGCYGLYTGTASFVQNDDGRWSITSYENIPMTSDIPEDEEIKEFVTGFYEEIDATYLAQFGLTMDQVLAYSDYNFETVDDMYFDYSEHRLGNLMSDAYRYAVNCTAYGQEHPADIAVVPAGTIRGSFHTGNITTADAFQCYSLGMGYDDEVGFPLVMFYLTGEEIKMIPEIDASLSSIMLTARLYCSGISYTTGTGRMLLNKAYDIKLNPEIQNDATTEIENDKLYSVVTDLYTARMLGSVSKISMGIIKIDPKYADGTVIESDENGILWDTVVVYNDEGEELKTWIAIASYLQSFEKNDEGISVIPEYYNELHGRKNVVTGFHPLNYFSQTNKYFWIFNGLIIVILAVIILIITGIVKLIKKLLGKKKTDKTDNNNRQIL